MNIVSLFDGISCGYVALQRANIKINNYYASEVDKYAIQVSSKNHPNIIQLGDINDWKLWSIDWKNIDLILAGSPCQGFSFAGKQLAFDDPRSKLFFVFVDILNHIKQLNPQVKFLLENVRMKKQHEQFISTTLSVDPILINSALVSAQNRKRLYWCNWNIEQPEDKQIVWGDIREKGLNANKYYYTEKAMQWLARYSRKHNRKLTVHADTEKMQLVEASHCKKYSGQRFFGVLDIPADEQCVASMRGRCIVNGKRQDSAADKNGYQQYIEFRYDNKSNCITTINKDNIIVPFTLPNRVPIGEFFFRFVTPLECERLQTLPDNYTTGLSDTQRYKTLGNGWTIDVIAHLLKSLFNQ